MADDTRVTKSRCALACAVVLFWALGCALPAVSNAAELLVQRDAGLSAHERADLRADAGVSFERTSALPRTELVSVPEGEQRAALAELAADPRVASAVPNVKFHAATTQVPPLTMDFWASYQWDLENLNDADIDLSSAWSTGPDPGNGVEVAVVDQLVHETHEDLGCPPTASDPCRDDIEHAAARNFVVKTECTAKEPVTDH